MATNALDYDIVNDELENHFIEMKKDCTRHDYRAQILRDTAETLSMHKDYVINNVDAEELGDGFREDELITVMSALSVTLNDVVERQNMSRVDHLKAAVFGQ